MLSGFEVAAVTLPYAYFEWAANLVPSPEVLRAIMYLDVPLALCITLGLCTKVRASERVSE